MPAAAQLTPSDIENLRAEIRRKGYSFTVSENPVTGLPIEQLCGLKPPPNWQATAHFQTLDAEPQAALPSRFDWRDYGGVTPIRDQRQCGSCWAFATIGTVESAVKRATGSSIDFSEQHLISCNPWSYSCGGGWWAYDMLKSSYGNPPREGGAVLESAFPYQADDPPDVPCGGPYTYPYKIASWAYISGNNNIPSVEQIKQAIYNRGPVGVAVHVGPLFSAYYGGIFDADETGDVNHAVMLVGWDDTQGAGGVWILRNSWNTRWGESGYMRIEYGKSQVGYAANWVDYTTANDGSIAGVVRSSGGQGISGAIVVANPGNYTATTIADGSYRMCYVPVGSNYSVQASKTGYTSQTVNGVSVPLNGVVSVDLTLSQGTGAVAGRVTSGGAGLPNATVTLTPTGLYAVTDTQGYYTISQVPPATYSATASKLGYYASTAPGVVVTSGYTTTQNFALAPIPEITIGGAKLLPDGTLVRLRGVILARLGDCFYLGDGLSRQAIKVAATTVLAEGAWATVSGNLGTLKGERLISGASVE